MKEGWKPKVGMKDKPAFEEICPGNWSQFVFRPYPWSGPYKYHQLPSGVVPVLEVAPGQPQKVKGFTVHCDGKFEVEKEDDNVSPKYATTKNPFPKEREGSLDVDKLKQFAMTKKQLNNPMLFYNLPNPILDTNPTARDGRQNYCFDVT